MDWSVLSSAGFMVVSGWEEGSCCVVECASVEYWAVCGGLVRGLLLLLLFGCGSWAKVSRMMLSSSWWVMDSAVVGGGGGSRRGP